MKKSNGFFLAELLLSLSAWVLAASFLLPAAMKLAWQSSTLQQENAALQLLYEELQMLVTDGASPRDYEVSKNGTNFHVYPKMNATGTEVCVEFESHFSKKISKCAAVEQ
ncbi:hypothetical protein CVD25_04440 [Bacillus canaveralius]|uniref:Type II secretion system protein n=1 Tax=Bacillus canaveralius TaxID=1403243 RepID=A0A2N5GRA0_9BACI|nr:MULTISPECIES: hypothetical protein [Bacillus]PLR85968.1 hypothetical protein CU635_02730 [Bacillus canaveralius]PLR87570.1 hypothetical protein CVD23_01465 [Bacillus sp. V33-4]PLS00087.1 hypothetical protein CVD25_04440 [Bacillus canaveralius]RSK53410.1 hypothetical protein EJA13_08560 [Bacillus canaveralius]